MQICKFSANHIEQAARIALQNYRDECVYVPALPPVNAVPDLTPFADNGLGVTAFDGNNMIGFLCAVTPFANAFRSTSAVGVFSPMGANGAVADNRRKIYARLYQVAGEKWVRAGAASHAICLYTHDKEAQEQFFRYGFGMRCFDAIRGMDAIDSSTGEGYTFSELAPGEVMKVFPLENKLDNSYLDSPFFMYREQSSEASF